MTFRVAAASSAGEVGGHDDSSFGSSVLQQPASSAPLPTPKPPRRTSAEASPAAVTSDAPASPAGTATPVVPALDSPARVIAAWAGFWLGGVLIVAGFVYLAAFVVQRST